MLELNRKPSGQHITMKRNQSLANARVGIKTSAVAAVALIVAACGGGGSGGVGAPPVVAGCGPYPAESSSPYILPYEAGTTHLVSQGNCTNRSHSPGTGDQYAYDFIMPIGTTLIASRPGTVTRIVDTFMDNTGVPGEENVVGVSHSDGTTALYFHLAENGALVTLNQMVQQGDPIALSGNSGNSTEAHLHLVVTSPAGTGGVGGEPVTFSNTAPHPNGLVEGVSYTAL